MINPYSAGTDFIRSINASRVNSMNKFILRWPIFLADRIAKGMMGGLFIKCNFIDLQGMPEERALKTSW